jgi:hypothetical protein
MRNLRTLLFAGAAAAALGLGATASARDTSDKSPPALGAAPAERTQCGAFDPSARTDWLALEPDFGAAFWKSPSLLADSDAFWAEIDRRMADVRCRMEALRRMALAPPAGAVPDAGAPLTTGSGGRFCTRSLAITQYGDAPPKIVRRSAGDCPGAAGDGADDSPDFEGAVRT